MKEIAQISEARAICALAIPTLAYLLFKFEISYTSDPKTKTMCAIYKNKKYSIELNEDYWLSLSLSEKAFGLFHEVMHIFLLHHIRGRTMKYDHRLWNLATDFYINYVLLGFYKDNGYIQYETKLQKYLTLPKGWLFDRNFVGLSADEIYDIIKNDPKFDNVDEVDRIMESEGSNEHEETEILKDVAAAAVYGNTNKSAGSTEGGLIRTFNDMIKPKINWKDILKTEFSRSEFSRLSYNKMSKKNYGGLIFPVKRGEIVKLVFGIDTSGSMSDADLKIGLGGVNEILNQYDNWEIILVTCDVKAHIIGHYKSENGDQFHHINKDFLGSGGTNMNPIIELANCLNFEEDFNFCVIFTDGFIPKIKTNALCETVFLVTPDGSTRIDTSHKIIKIEV